MGRPLTFLMAQALRDGRPLTVLCELNHPSGTFRVWTGVGELSYNGFTWIGLGTLGKITPVRSTTEMAIQEVIFELSGVEASALALLDLNVRNRLAYAWLAVLDERGEIIADPYQLLEAELDYQTHKIGDDGLAVIAITARSGFYTLERALNDSWSHEDQQIRFPGDTGLSLLSSLQSKETLWTRT